MALKAGDDLGNAQGRVRLDGQVDVIGHHFERVDRHIVLAGNVLEQRLEPGIDRTDQDRAPVLGAPDDVVLERKTAPTFLAYRELGIPVVYTSGRDLT